MNARPDPISFFRYVLYERVEDYFRLGWAFAADLGPVHGQYSVLMAWPCQCKLVEPKVTA